MSEKIQISESRLRALLHGEDTAEQALADYFTIDESKPFAPEYVLKPEVQVISQERGLVGDLLWETAVDVANAIKRRQRQRKYAEIVKLYPDRLRLVAEGDSWFQHPMIDDTIDHLFNHFAIYCVSAGGDELSNMFMENEYMPALTEQKAEGLLLSGGGNDLLGGRFGSYLNEYTPGTDPRRFLKDEFFARLDDMIRIYQTIFESMQKRKPEVKIFTHGYDFVIPQKAGKWLGKAMGDKRIEASDDQKAVIRIIINDFDDKMLNLAAQYPNAVFVDVRDTVRDKYWADEIHPDKDGFQQVALKFVKMINAVLPRDQV